MSRKHKRTSLIGKRPVQLGLHQPSKQEIVTRIARQIRRDEIARGIIPTTVKRPPRYKFLWSYGNLSGVVYDDNRSQARGQIKRELGIPRKRRLPIEIVIQRHPNESSTSSPEATSGSDN